MLKRWQKFVESSYVEGRNLDYEAISLMITRDAFFDFRDVRQIAGRYIFYRNVGFQLQNLSNRIDDFSRVASPNDAFDLQALEAAIDRLTKEQRRLNTGNEMVMMQLQDAMQRRSQILQLGANMLAATDDATKTIIGNLR